MIKNFLFKVRRLIIAGAIVLYKRAFRIATAIFAVYIIILVTQASYYRFMPGSWFINVTQQPFVSNAKVSDPLLMKFCRDTRAANIKALGVRSFYSIISNGQVSAGHYDFSAVIEKVDHCQYIRIPQNKHPQAAGNYVSHTDLTFYVEGHKKIVSYETNQFVLSDTKESLENQIKDLQNQIQQLRGQLGDNTPIQSSISTTPANGTPLAATPTQSQVQQAATDEAAITQADNQATTAANQGSRFDQIPVLGRVFKVLGL